MRIISKQKNHLFWHLWCLLVLETKFTLLRYLSAAKSTFKELFVALLRTYPKHLAEHNPVSFGRVLRYSYCSKFFHRAILVVPVLNKKEVTVADHFSYPDDSGLLLIHLRTPSIFAESPKIVIAIGQHCASVDIPNQENRSVAHRMDIIMNVWLNYWKHNDIPYSGLVLSNDNNSAQYWTSIIVFCLGSFGFLVLDVCEGC